LETNKEGYPCLLSGGAPDSPVHHRSVTVDGPVQISFMFWRRRPLQIRGSWRTGHCPVRTRQSGAHCRPLARATHRPRIARPTVALAVVGSPDSPVNYSRTPPNSLESGLFAGVQPGAPDSPVNYSRTPPNSPESGLFAGVQLGAPDTVRCTTG
jgi:hypothetical protein